jgi:hypothetical protein
VALTDPPLAIIILDLCTAVENAPSLRTKIGPAGPPWQAHWHPFKFNPAGRIGSNNGTPAGLYDLLILNFMKIEDR